MSYAKNVQRRPYLVEYRPTGRRRHQVMVVQAESAHAAALQAPGPCTILRCAPCPPPEKEAAHAQ